MLDWSGGRHARPPRFLAPFVATLLVVTTGVLAHGQGGAPAGRRASAPGAAPAAVPPAVTVVPALPPGADRLDPITVTVDIITSRTGGPRSERRVTMLRTPDRVLMRTSGSPIEWLFERNPVDARRAAGYLTDHQTRRVLVYDDTDLRRVEGIRGWADVLTLRFDAAWLSRMRRTGSSGPMFGAAAEQYVAVDGAGPKEVWWSPGLQLPLRLEFADQGGTSTLTVRSVTRGVDPAPLALPRQRFPAYQFGDAVDELDDEH